MDVNEIMDAVRPMTLAAKKEIAYKVIREIDRLEILESAEARFAAIIQTAEEVTGLRYDPERRDYCSVMLRTVTAWRMMDEGHSVSDIGRAMGKDHSSVSHYAAQRRDAKDFPAAYRSQLALYGKLVLALNDKQYD